MTEYIEREAVLDYIRYKVCQGEGNIEHRCQRGSCAYCGICEIMCDISSMPVADVQPVKRGHWIETDYGMFYECSECGTVQEFERNFCSKCGADMRSPEAIKG